MHDQSQRRTDAHQTTKKKSHENSLQKVKEQLEKMTDVAARAQADLQNFKIRMEREAQELRQYCIVPLLLKLLPIRDDLTRAASHLSETEGSVLTTQDGLRFILEKFDRTLEEVGLRKTAARGMRFDPRKHEVLNTGSGEKEAVIRIYEEGYELHGRILRPAKVQVGDGLSTENPPPSLEEAQS